MAAVAIDIANTPFPQPPIKLIGKPDVRKFWIAVPLECSYYIPSTAAVSWYSSRQSLVVESCSDFVANRASHYDASFAMVDWCPSH